MVGVAGDPARQAEQLLRHESGEAPLVEEVAVDEHRPARPRRSARTRRRAADDRRPRARRSLRPRCPGEERQQLAPAQPVACAEVREVAARDRRARHGRRRARPASAAHCGGSASRLSPLRVGDADVETGRDERRELLIDEALGVDREAPGADRQQARTGRRPEHRRSSRQRARQGGPRARCWRRAVSRRRARARRRRRSSPAAPAASAAGRLADRRSAGPQSLERSAT